MTRMPFWAILALAIALVLPAMNLTAQPEFACMPEENTTIVEYAADIYAFESIGYQLEAFINAAGENSDNIDTVIQLMAQLEMLQATAAYAGETPMMTDFISSLEDLFGNQLKAVSTVTDDKLDHVMLIFLDTGMTAYVYPECTHSGGCEDLIHDRDSHIISEIVINFRDQDGVLHEAHISVGN